MCHMIFGETRTMLLWLLKYWYLYWVQVDIFYIYIYTYIFFFFLFLVEITRSIFYFLYNFSFIWTLSINFFFYDISNKMYLFSNYINYSYRSYGIYSDIPLHYVPRSKRISQFFIMSCESQFRNCLSDFINFLYLIVKHKTINKLLIILVQLFIFSF